MTTVLQRGAQLAAIGVKALVDQAPIDEELRRPVSLYLLVTACNLPGATVAIVAGCSKQNISKMVARVERLREGDRKSVV